MAKNEAKCGVKKQYMDIKNQVCTLEQARRLSQLGLSNNSYFLIGEDNKEPIEAWSVEGNEDTFYPALTCSEIAVMLPSKPRAIGWELWYSSITLRWFVRIRDISRWDGRSNPPVLKCSAGDTMAITLADALIWSLEKGLVSAGDCFAKLEKYSFFNKSDKK